MKSIFYFSVLFILLISIPEKIDLRGHWHVYPVDNTKLGGISYTIMEIYDNKTAAFDVYDKESSFQGRISRWNKTLEFGGECRILDFGYEFNGNGLLLTQQNYGGRFKAIRCDNDCCDQQKDFFSYQKLVNIDLPIAKDTLDYIPNNFQKSLEHRLLYGLPKKKYHTTCFGAPEGLVLNWKMASEYDLPIWHEKVLIKTNEKNHAQIKIIIYADKGISMNRGIKEAFKQLREIGYKRVYIALRSESTNQDFKIWLKPFDLSNLEELNKSNDFRTVGEWLTTSSIAPN